MLNVLDNLTEKWDLKSAMSKLQLDYMNESEEIFVKTKSSKL